MKKGDIIRCHDPKALLQTQKDLELAGFHAVVSYDGAYTLRITGVPETQYLVEARDHHGAMQRAYCDTLEEAGEIATEYENGYEFVEILKGYAGEWESVAQSW